MEIHGEPWFVAADVCRAIGYNVKNNGSVNVSQATAILDPDEINTCRISVRGGKPSKLISESGLYKLILRSDKPQAKQFQDWVTRDVLPAIRKTGSYVSCDPHTGFDEKMCEGIR
nr:BRO family protein [uncultured Cohaesibacter sp.]